MTRNKVVLPAPLPPHRAQSPRSMVNEMRSSASRDPKRRVMPSSASRPAESGSDGGILAGASGAVRDADGEGGAGRPGVAADGAAVVVDDLLDDRQPEAGAALLARREHLEQPRLHRRRDAGPVVGRL